MNGPWEGVKKGEKLHSLLLDCSGISNLPHNNIRKLSKRVHPDLNSGGDLTDGVSVVQEVRNQN